MCYVSGPSDDGEWSVHVKWDTIVRTSSLVSILASTYVR